LASNYILEKSGLRREGIFRKAVWNAAGRRTDGYRYSILSEEWKEPKILTKTT